MQEKLRIQTVGNDISELKKVMGLVWRTFMEFEAPEYSREGVDHFLEYINVHSILPLVEAGHLLIWKACLGQRIVGVIAVAVPGHISLLFVEKEFQKQGIGRKLYEKALIYCLKKYKIESMTVNSSPYAIPFYACLGFIADMEEQLEEGIRYTPMTHILF